MKIHGPGESSLLLLRVISLLNRFKVPYVIIGAFAVSFYGQVRASLDADAVISIDGREKILERISEILRKSGSIVSSRSGDRDDPIKGVVCIEDRHHNRVDLLTGIRGMQGEVFKRAVTTVFMNRKIKIACVEDLMAMKIFAGSPKDMDDVRGIWAVSGTKVNIALLRQVTQKYGKKELAKLEPIINSPCH